MTGKELLQKLILIQETNPDLLGLQVFNVYEVYPKRMIKGTSIPRLGRLAAKYTSNQFGEQAISPEKAIQLSDVAGFDFSKIKMDVYEINKPDNANVLLI